MALFYNHHTLLVSFLVLQFPEAMGTPQELIIEPPNLASFFVKTADFSINVRHVHLFQNLCFSSNLIQARKFYSVIASSLD